MGLRSLLRKAGIGLGSLLLAGNLGCNSSRYHSNTDLERQPVEQKDLEQLTEYKPKSRKGLKLWQYPVNLAGGFFTHILAHEGGHAVTALAHGVGIEEFHSYPGVVNGEFHGGWVRYEPESYHDTSPQERALMSIAGPTADIALAEVINYNLRNGKISEKYQPFWATTSLMARGGPLWIAIGSLKGSKLNDFAHFEEHTGVPKETMASLVFLYTALNAKRISKEFKVALGKDSYKYNPGGKGELNLLPYKDGLMISYNLNF